MKNTARRNLLIWFGVGLLGWFMLFIPSIWNIDMSSGGGAMVVIGLLVGITGPIVAILYWTRSSVFDQLLKEENLLAHWRYNPTEWKNFATEEKIFRQGEQRGLQWLVIGMSVLIGGIFWWADPESGWIVAVVLLAVNLLIAGVVWLNGRSVSGWVDAQNVECRIGKNGLMINGQLHVWTGWGARLDELSLGQSKTGQILAITYSIPSRYSRQYYTIRALVPTDKLAEAQTLSSRLGLNN